MTGVCYENTQISSTFAPRMQSPLAALRKIFFNRIRLSLQPGGRITLVDTSRLAEAQKHKCEVNGLMLVPRKGIAFNAEFYRSLVQQLCADQLQQHSPIITTAFMQDIFFGQYVIHPEQMSLIEQTEAAPSQAEPVEFSPVTKSVLISHLSEQTVATSTLLSQPAPRSSAERTKSLSPKKKNSKLWFYRGVALAIAVLFSGLASILVGAFATDISHNASYGSMIAGSVATSVSAFSLVGLCIRNYFYTRDSYNRLGSSSSGFSRELQEHPQECTAIVTPQIDTKRDALQREPLQDKVSIIADRLNMPFGRGL